MCDRVMIISNGVLVASDNIDNLESLISQTNKLHMSIRCERRDGRGCSAVHCWCGAG